MINHGIIPGPAPTDWASSDKKIPHVVRVPDSNWYPFLVTGEKQAFSNFDTMSCVSFAVNNVMEMQIKQQTGREVNYSDRFLAKMSGTSQSEGNRVSTVLDIWKKYGGVPESVWPKPAEPTTWNAYMSPIPQSVINQAKKPGETAYEYLLDPKAITGWTPEFIRYHLQEAPLLVTIPGHEITGVVLDVDNTHITVLDDYIFNVDPNQPFIHKIKLTDITYLYKAVLTVKGSMSNVKLVKNGKEFGYYLPANSEGALIDKADNFGYPLPKTPEGKVDWAKVKPEIII